LVETPKVAPGNGEELGRIADFFFLESPSGSRMYLVLLSTRFWKRLAESDPHCCNHSFTQLNSESCLKWITPNPLEKGIKWYRLCWNYSQTWTAIGPLFMWTNLLAHSSNRSSIHANRLTKFVWWVRTCCTPVPIDGLIACSHAGRVCMRNAFFLNFPFMANSVLRFCCMYWSGDRWRDGDMKWLCCNCHVDDEEDGHDKEQAKAQSNKIDRTLLAFNACLCLVFVNSGITGTSKVM
jgi:hypothetical protein